MEKQLGSIVDRPILEASEAHIALALVLDISASMGGKNIESLNRSVNQMIRQIQEDDRLSKIVDLGIFTFGEKGKNPVYKGFRAISDCSDICLEANDGNTYVVDTLNTTMERLRERRHLYANAGGAYKPWVILITDGCFHDAQNELMQVAEKMKIQESTGRLRFFGLGVEGYNRLQLECFTKNPKYIIEINQESLVTRFAEFFTWVGNSMATISEKTPLDEKEGKGTLPPLVFSL